MKRTVEPELMTEKSQALAYARADFESAHSSYPKLFTEKFPRPPRRAHALDLGCGPCDVTIRFANANPGWHFMPSTVRQRCSSMPAPPSPGNAISGAESS